MNSIYLYYEQDILWGNQKLEIEEEKRIIDTVSLIPSDVKSVIDVGCGDGRILNFLQRQSRYKKLIGIDRSMTGLKYVNTEKILASIDSIPFPDKSFDIVLCLEVLEHLPYDIYPKALAEIQRVSRKYILISVLNNENIKGSFVTCPMCGCEFSPHRHLRTFNVDSISSLFSEFTLIDKKFSSIRKQFMLEYYFRKAGVFFGVLESFPEKALCPQCGFHKKVNISEMKQHTYGRTKKIMSLIKILIPGIKEGKWLIALYLRK